MKNRINLRSEFSEFINDYGFYVLLHRNGRKIHCRCWSEKYQEGDSNCMLCGGEGWVGRIERHKVRANDSVDVVTQPGRITQTPIGKMDIGSYNFHFPHNAYPKVGDLVYEVGWHGQKPTHLIQAHRINHSIPHRGDNGRIEFWSVAARTETVSSDFKDILVRSIGPIQNYEIVHQRT